MARRAPLAAAALALTLTGLAGCVAAAPQAGGDAAAGAARGAPQTAVYRGVQTRLLEDDLVNFVVAMRGARDGADVIAYARCAAAQYALIRGFGFARHVRTTVTEHDGLWQADAVYVVSPSLPRGVRTIDAEVTVADCIELGIPTV